MRLLGIAGITSAAVFGACGTVTLGHATVHPSTRGHALVRPATPTAGQCSSVGADDQVTVANALTVRTRGLHTSCGSGTPDR